MRSVCGAHVGSNQDDLDPKLPRAGPAGGSWSVGYPANLSILLSSWMGEMASFDRAGIAIFRVGEDGNASFVVELVGSCRE